MVIGICHIEVRAVSRDTSRKTKICRITGAVNVTVIVVACNGFDIACRYFYLANPVIIGIGYIEIDAISRDAMRIMKPCVYTVAILPIRGT